MLSCLYADWDHPRRCGEHVSPLMAMVSAEGSSPQMRGALLNPGDDTSPLRIIPADAGSTRHPTRVCMRGGDHPRRCGEHMPLSAEDQDWPGSSPQMRGAHGKTYEEAAVGRIIPADAGSTSPFLKNFKAW